MSKFSYLLFIVIFFSACHLKPSIKKNDAIISNNIYLDVISDNKLDTLIVEPFPSSPNLKILKIKRKDVYEEICIIKLRNDSIANLYIEANNVNQINKGIRLMVRNTDFIPDYKYIDIEFHDKWKIKTIGHINTNPDSKLESCLYKLDIDIREYEEVDVETKQNVLDVVKVVSRSNGNNFECD